MGGILLHDLVQLLVYVFPSSHRHFAFCLVHLCTLGNHHGASSVALSVKWFDLNCFGVRYSECVLSLCQLLSWVTLAIYFTWVSVSSSVKLGNHCKVFIKLMHLSWCLRCNTCLLSSLPLLLYRTDILFPQLIDEVTERSYMTYQSPLYI